MQILKTKSRQDINLWRFGVFAFSFLLIPAFSYGFISFWVVSYAILLAVFFDKRLKEIIVHAELIQNEWKRCKASIMKYFLLVAELAIIVTIAPAIMMLLDFSAADKVTIWDETVLNFSPLPFPLDNLLSAPARGMKPLHFLKHVFEY